MRLAQPGALTPAMLVISVFMRGALAGSGLGDPKQWGFEHESEATYTSFGQEDPWVSLGQQLGLPPQDYNHNGHSEYWFNVASGVPWSRMRVVGVCAARGTCPASVPG